MLWQDKAEEKVRQMEARAEQQRKAKQAADAEWRKQQRLREVQRAEVCTLNSPVSTLIRPQQSDGTLFQG